MQEIEFTNLIITCEACGNVKRYLVRSQDECDRIFREFRCENGCGRNLCSFITLGTLKHPDEQAANGEQMAADAAQEEPAAANGDATTVEPKKA